MADMWMRAARHGCKTRPGLACRTWRSRRRTAASCTLPGIVKPSASCRISIRPRSRSMARHGRPPSISTRRRNRSIRPTGRPSGPPKRPGAAKQLAARPDPRRARRSWFADFAQEPRADWPEVKLDLMRRADWAKFTQHETLQKRLLATGTAELVEDSPYDAFWGTGPDGAGLNWAGRVLMRDPREASRPCDPDTLIRAGARAAHPGSLPLQRIWGAGQRALN